MASQGDGFGFRQDVTPGPKLECMNCKNKEVKLMSRLWDESR